MPHHGLQHKVRKMTETKPLNEDGSPPHREAQTVKLEMKDKMVKKTFIIIQLILKFFIFQFNEWHEGTQVSLL